MKAIILPYAVDQNEPSRPISMLVDIPDDIQERDELLKQLFVEYVLDSEDDLELTITEGNERSYGDVIVSYDDSIFMYVVFITN